MDTKKTLPKRIGYKIFLLISLFSIGFTICQLGRVCIEQLHSANDNAAVSHHQQKLTLRHQSFSDSLLIGNVKANIVAEFDMPYGDATIEMKKGIWRIVIPEADPEGNGNQNYGLHTLMKVYIQQRRDSLAQTVRQGDSFVTDSLCLYRTPSYYGFSSFKFYHATLAGKNLEKQYLCTTFDNSDGHRCDLNDFIKPQYRKAILSIARKKALCDSCADMLALEKHIIQNACLTENCIMWDFNQKGYTLQFEIPLSDLKGFLTERIWKESWRNCNKERISRTGLFSSKDKNYE